MASPQAWLGCLILYADYCLIFSVEQPVFSVLGAQLRMSDIRFNQGTAGAMLLISSRASDTGRARLSDHLMPRAHTARERGGRARGRVLRGRAGGRERKREGGKAGTKCYQLFRCQPGTWASSALIVDSK